MKTTIELPDALLAEARRRARERGQPLRALVEEGLRRVIAEPVPPPFTLVDRSVGQAGAPNPLAGLTWEELRDAIYGDTP